MEFGSTSDVVLPDSARLLGKSCVGRSPGEIAPASYAEFARFVRSEADVCGLVMADWTVSGVRFWLSGNIREENAFRPEGAFRRLKAVDCLMPRRKDLSRTACVTLAASSLGAARRRISDERGRCSFQNEPGDENGAFTEARRKLTGATGPEAARRLEADLAGRDFVSDLERRKRPGGTGAMTWHESSGCVKVKPDELSLVPAGELTSFMRTCDFCGRSRLGTVRWMPDMVQFWLGGSSARAMDMPCAVAWMKKVNFLMLRQKDPKAVNTVAATARCGAAEWQILDEKGTVVFSRKSEGERECARAVCLELVKTVKPEAVRRLEADLSGKRFVSDLELRRRLAS